MSTDELDLDALREVAEGATEGPWFMDDTYATVTAAPFTSAMEAYNRDRASVDSDCWVVPESSDSSVGRHNLAHIATFDPPTVLALLDRVEAAEGKVARVEALLVPTYLSAGDETHGMNAHVEPVPAEDLRQALEDAPEPASAPETDA